LKGVSVAEDKDKNTITLSGKLHSEETKASHTGSASRRRNAPCSQRNQRAACGFGIASQGDQQQP
jgi:hypothetical protein